MATANAVVPSLVGEHSHAFVSGRRAVWALHGKVVRSVICGNDTCWSFRRPAAFFAPLVEYAVRSVALAAKDLIYRRTFTAGCWVDRHLSPFACNIRIVTRLPTKLASLLRLPIFLDQKCYPTGYSPPGFRGHSASAAAAPPDRELEKNRSC